MSKKEPKFGVDCCGCLHGVTPEWCGRCRITLCGTPSCYLHCSMTNGHITPIKEFCAKCKKYKKCEYDAGFRYECIYNGTGVPSEFKPEGIRDSMEQKEKPSPREEILREAIKCVCSDRNQQYGEPEDNFRMIGEVWESYISEKCIKVYNGEEGKACCDLEILPEDVALLMVLFKVCRGATGEKITKDTLVDIAGYAACAGGMIE